MDKLKVMILNIYFISILFQLKTKEDIYDLINVLRPMVNELNEYINAMGGEYK